MKNVLSLCKPLGKTPLQCIDEFRTQNPAYSTTPMCYAGRLDPMASGLLLVLVGEECKKRKEYELLRKKYEFSVLFGLETDTYDSLGLVQKKPQNMTAVNIHLFTRQLKKIVSSQIGTQQQPYPPYSSARILGKPLFWWAREGRLQEVTIPSKQIEIYAMQIHTPPVTIPYRIVLKEAVHRTQLVTGQFRQEEIRASWESWNNLEVWKQGSGILVSFRISCSSGTYVRSLAQEMGMQTGTGAIAWHIHRTEVGEYTMPL